MKEETVTVRLETLRELVFQLSSSRFGTLLRSIDTTDAHTIVDLWREETAS